MATLTFQSTQEEIAAEIARAARRGRKRAEGPFVYFIQCGEDGPIKIGWAGDPGARLTDMQIASPYPMKIIAQVRGGRGAEQAFHREFAADRIRGEWFKRTPELLARISQLPPA